MSITTPMAVHAFTLRGPVWRSDAWLIREFRPRCVRDELPPILATVQLDLFAPSMPSTPTPPPTGEQ